MGGTGINVMLHNNTINTYEYRVKRYLTYFSLNLPWIYRRQNFATNFILAFLPPLIPGLIKSPRQPPPFNCQLLIKDFGVWTSLPIGSTQSDQRGCPCYHHLQMMYDIMSYNGTLEQQVWAQVGQHIFVAKEKQFGKNEVRHHGEDFPRNTLSFWHCPIWF